MRKLGFIKKLGFIIGIIVLLMAVMPMSDGLPAQAQGPDWYYKPGNFTDYALSGMPDFDQKQDAWTNPLTGNWSYCGPTAVANSLWWFDSRNETGGIPPPNSSDNYYLVTNYSIWTGTLNPWDDHDVRNVEPLVDDLSWFMNTDGKTWGGGSGTDVTEMQYGIDAYLIYTGYYGYYYEQTVLWPDFYWIEEEVERCEDVILLLGFYQDWDGYYERIGGHYVTVAGVNSNGTKLGISDPAFDNAEAGGPGRVLPPSPPHPPAGHNASVHNDTWYVSHDTYDVVQVFPMNMAPCWALTNYAVGKNVLNFAGQNGGPVLPGGAYDPLGPPVETIIDYAVAVSPKPDLNGDIESDYGWAEEEGNVSVTVHVTNETMDGWIWDMEIFFWDENGTQLVWMGGFLKPFPLLYCVNYTFNVTWGATFLPEMVVIHFSNEGEENIGFVFSYPTEEPEPPGWYWKPGDWPDYAPSGMPDFDQRQDGWFNSVGRWTYCGPTAVANSLWWFDSREETGGIPPPTSSDNYGLVTSYNASGWDDHDPQNVIPLVNDLSWLMDTDGLRTGMPHNGTDVHDMEWGIDQYLNNTGYDADYYEVTVESPDFYWIEEEVERCEDVILLLGFWQCEEIEPGLWYWWRVGGHYVTCAGVNSDYLLLGLSDPFFDNAELGGPGRVLPPTPTHPPAGHNAGVHNDTWYVSHDIYDVIWDPCPGGDWSLANYTDGKKGYLYNFQGQNPYPHPDFDGEYWDWLPVHTQIEFAVAISPINATLVGHVDFWRATPAPCSTYVTGVEVRFFDNSTGNETGWSPINRTTDDQGNFTIGGIAPGTYDIGIKNWTCLGKMNMSVTLNASETKVVYFPTPTEADSMYNDDMADGWDYSFILNNLGAMKVANATAWEANEFWKGDFNRDEMLDGWDYSSVLNNLGAFGDVFIYTH